MFGDIPGCWEGSLGGDFGRRGRFCGIFKGNKKLKNRDAREVHVVGNLST
jgi:hypothetical protein